MPRSIKQLREHLDVNKDSYVFDGAAIAHRETQSDIVDLLPDCVKAPGAGLTEDSGWMDFGDKDQGDEPTVTQHLNKRTRYSSTYYYGGGSSSSSGQPAQAINLVVNITHP